MLPCQNLYEAIVLGMLILEAGFLMDPFHITCMLVVQRQPMQQSTTNAEENLPMQYTEIFEVVENKKKINRKLLIFFLFLLKT